MSLPLPPNRGRPQSSTKTTHEAIGFGAELVSSSKGGERINQYRVMEKSYAEVFKSGLLTGTAFSVVFLVSESIPVFMQAALPEWSEAASRGIALAIWLPAAIFFVYVLSKVL